MFWQTKSPPTAWFLPSKTAQALLAKGGQAPRLIPPGNEMARPSENLTARLTIRMKPEELAQLQQDADTAAVDVTTMARAQILNAPIPKRKYRRSVDHEKLADVLQSLGKVGTNLNQIAKVANSNGDLAHFRDAKLLKNLLEEIRDEVRAALTP